MRIALVIIAVAGLAALCASGQGKPPQTQPATAGSGQARTLAAEYPGLASAGLVHARLADLPQGVLLQAGGLAIREPEVADEIAKAPTEVRAQLRKNALFLLEQMATRRLLLAEAKAAAARDGKDAGRLPERELLQNLFEKLTADVRVTDQEIADFYSKNKDMVGPSPFEQIKPAIANYLRQQKQQDRVAGHVEALGRRMPIDVSASWVKEQAVSARDNPVDKARASGRPSLVDFGAKGCRPCDMLAPILEALKRKYEGRANVLFVSVREEQILASRYGIQSIPVQIFFEAGGKEVFRHTGFWPQEELERKLAEIGVK